MSDAAIPETLPFRVLLDEAMQRVRRHLRTLVLPFGLALGLAGGLSALLNVVLMSEILGFAAQTVDPADASFAGVGCGAFLGVFALLGVQMLIVAAMGAVAMDVVAGREIRLRERAMYVLRPRVLGTLALLAVAMALSALACLLPALYVTPLLSFTLPAMVDEERFGLRALERSAELARHHPGGDLLTHPLVKIFVLLFVSYLLSAAVSMVIQVPFAAAQQWVLLRNLSEGGAEAGAEVGAIPPAMLWSQVPAQFLGGLISSLPALWASFGIAMLFADCRKRKEGMDLEAAIDEIDRRRGGERSPQLSPPAPPLAKGEP